AVMKKRLEAALDQSGERRYAAVIDEARDTLADAQAEVDEAAAELEDGKRELAKGKKELADGKKELADGQKEIEDNKKKIEDAKVKLEDGRRELEENRKKLEDAKAELADGRAKYEDGLAEFEAQRDAAYAQINQALVSGMMPQYMYDAQKAQIDQQLAPAKAELDAALAEIEAGEAEIADGEKQLADGEKEIADAEAEIADGEKQLADGEKELADARSKIADAEKEIADAEAEIADGEKKIADARKELKDAEKEIDDIEYPTTYVLGRDANVGYACFESDSSIVDGISRVFPVFFFLIAALVCMTTMTRMIDEQRTQIGVLKALGYSRRQIMSKYVIYSGSAAVLGSVIGFFIGIHLFPWVIWTVYGLMYGFANIIFIYNWALGLICLGVALLCCVGTTVWCCSTELREVPAQLIRPKAPQAGKRIWLEYLPFIWNKLSFLVKVSIRNTFRYRKRFIMMVIGISGCTALLVTGLGINDSVSNLAALQYDTIYHVDYTVSFKKDMNEKNQQRFLEEADSVIEDCLFVHSSSVDAKANGFTKAVTMIVSDDAESMPAYIELFNDDGPIDWPSEGKAVLNSNLADNMGLSVGDMLSVYDSDMREMQLEISGLCDNYVNSYLYLSQETYENSWGPMETNAALVLGKTSEEGIIADPYGDSTIMLDARNVSAVSLTEDMRGRIEGMIGTLSYIVLLVIACAGALAFIVLYNLTNINITERIREIATIKVLGFYAGETAQYVFRENILLTAIAAVVGLPLGKALHTFVLSQVTVDALSFHMYISPLSYALGVVITFVFAFLVNLVMQRKLTKISMTESLKSIE
ncbi:MAG: FtsX-like permease family protein, partial [Firmicutes bacterium]|nr:FtsX-like permease family protein [Bacillota bacterium]